MQGKVLCVLLNMCGIPEDNVQELILSIYHMGPRL